MWVHKTANILDKLDKKPQQPRAKRMLQDIWMAETRKDAEAAFDAFDETYAVKYEKTAECLKKDQGPAARLLRLPGRTLEAPAYVESDRKHLYRHTGDGLSGRPRARTGGSRGDPDPGMVHASRQPLQGGNRRGPACGRAR